MEILKELGIGTFQREPNQIELIKILENDSLSHKRILRKIFLLRLSQYFKCEIKKTDNVNKYIPRSRRGAIIFELEKSLTVEFPELVLAKWRILVGIACFIIPLTLFLSITENKGTFIIYFAGIAGISAAVAFVLIFILLFALPVFFEPLDFKEITTIDDLLLILSLKNSKNFSANNFELTIMELIKLEESTLTKLIS